MSCPGGAVAGRRCDRDVPWEAKRRCGRETLWLGGAASASGGREPAEGAGGGRRRGRGHGGTALWPESVVAGRGLDGDTAAAAAAAKRRRGRGSVGERRNQIFFFFFLSERGGIRWSER